MPPLCGLLLLVLPLVNPLSAKNEVLKHKRAEVKLSIKNNQVSTAATVFAFLFLRSFVAPFPVLAHFSARQHLVDTHLEKHEVGMYRSAFALVTVSRQISLQTDTSTVP